jgi:DNA primase
MKDADLGADVARLKATVSIATVIGETIPLKRAGRLLIACCPFHAERTPSFYVFADHFHCFGCGAHGDAITFVMKTRGVSFPEAVAHLGGVGDLSRTRAATPAPAPALARVQADDGEARLHRELAARIWTEAADPPGSPVENYLHRRGVHLPGLPVLRWHPRCPRAAGALPAMVALMVDPVTGEPSGVHRTFIQPDGSGKAAVSPAKMMLGRAGVIRLAELTGEGLGLAEGIETALSVMQTIGWRPVWAAGSRGGIETFPVLPAIALTIFADGDAPGLKAACACAGRWAAAGAEALICTPPGGLDWNDAAMRRNAA